MRHIWSRENGFVLKNDIAKSFDRSILAIIPWQLDTTRNEFKIVVIDENYKYYSFDASMPDFKINGRKLDFHDDKLRPEWRYLYIHHVIKVLRYHRRGTL